jgi:hypothetical protein
MPEVEEYRSVSPYTASDVKCVTAVSFNRILPRTLNIAEANPGNPPRTIQTDESRDSAVRLIYW